MTLMNGNLYVIFSTGDTSSMFTQRATSIIQYYVEMK